MKSNQKQTTTSTTYDGALAAFAAAAAAKYELTTPFEREALAYQIQRTCDEVTVNLMKRRKQEAKAEVSRQKATVGLQSMTDSMNKRWAERRKLAAA
jgi:hypothetical protein